MQSYDVPGHSPLERVDALLEMVEKKVYEITDNVNKVNEKLLPSIEKDKQIAEETKPEKVQPRGWFEKKIHHLERIQNLLCRANEGILRLKDTVVERVPVKRDVQ